MTDYQRQNSGGQTEVQRPRVRRKMFEPHFHPSLFLLYIVQFNASMLAFLCIDLVGPLSNNFTRWVAGAWTQLEGRGRGHPWQVLTSISSTLNSLQSSPSRIGSSSGGGGGTFCLFLSLQIFLTASCTFCNFDSKPPGKRRRRRYSESEEYDTDSDTDRQLDQTQPTWSCF